MPQAADLAPGLPKPTNRSSPPSQGCTLTGTFTLTEPRAGALRAATLPARHLVLEEVARSPPREAAGWLPLGGSALPSRGELQGLVPHLVVLWARPRVSEVSTLRFFSPNHFPAQRKSF